MRIRPRGTEGDLARATATARGRWSGRALMLCGWLALCVAMAGCSETAVARATAPSPSMSTATVTPVPTTTATPSAPAKPAASVPCDRPSAPARTFSASQLQRPFLITKDELTNCVLMRAVIPAPPAGMPDSGGKLILVSLGQQWLWAYDDHKLTLATPITSGQPYLWTPQGSFQVLRKDQDTTFYSPWLPGSPFYYTPEHVNYALFFRDKGFYIHDAPWRRYFGPGTDEPHTNPDGTPETGSHGCVNMPTSAGAWLFTWADIGTAIEIVE